MFDFDALTLGEVARIEELSGQSIASIASADTPKGNALAAMAMVIKRRSGEPTFTWNAALALTLDEANEILGIHEEVDEDSEEGKDEASPENAPKKKRPSSSTSA